MVVYNPFDRRAKTAPSSYPRLVFHGIRCAQLVSSLVVGAIMSYFIWHLTHDHWATPWTFIWLTSASLFSIAALGVTILLHCCIGLNPRFNLALNGFLLLLWGLSWSLLTYYMSPTLGNMCDIEHWHEGAGIMVCRIYKALFAFTLLGFVSTIAAFILDIYVHRKNTRRGMYRLQDLGGQGDKKTAPAVRGPFTDDSAQGFSRERHSEAWDMPSRPSMGPYSETEHRNVAGQGYAVPEGQFGYDTGYRGHGMR